MMLDLALRIRAVMMDYEFFQPQNSLRLVIMDVARSVNLGRRMDGVLLCNFLPGLNDHDHQSGLARRRCPCLGRSIE